MPSKPRIPIAITYDFDSRLGYFLKADLVERLTSLGFELHPLTYHKSEMSKLKHVRGLMIPGGLSDLPPASYGQRQRHARVKQLKNRCDFEFRLLDHWLKSPRPLLAICWGMQLLNVYCGGTLYQHLPKDFPSPVDHEQKPPSHRPSHWVRFAPVGLARMTFGATKLPVNSTHHQGLDQLGDGIVAEGWSEDDLVECARLSHHPYAWAVQWHPERLTRDPIIPSFVKACRRQR